MYKLRLLFLSTILLGSSPALGNHGTVGLGLNASALYGGLPSAGLELEYNFNPMFSIGFTANAGGIDISKTIEDEIKDQDKGLDVNIKDAMVSRSLLLATAKYYPFKGSFNVGLATGPGVTIAKLAVTSSETDEMIDENYTYQQTVAAITIGNTWRWKHFYVGFDWLGYMGVVSSNKDKESKSTALANLALSEAFKKFEDIADLFGEGGGPVALSFKIGTGF